MEAPREQPQLNVEKPEEEQDRMKCKPFVCHHVYDIL